MCTRSSSNLIVESFTIPKQRNRRRSKQIVEPEHQTIVETPVATMADTRTMSKLLQAPTEGYGDAIVIPSLLAENFELKFGLLSLVTSSQFHGFERDDPHSHIPWTWLEKEPRRSIHTWEDLVLKFMNYFFPPSKTTNLKNDITNFQQKFDETFNSLKAAALGNSLNHTPRDALTIIGNKSKVRTSRNKAVVSKVNTTTSSTSPSPDVTALTEIVKELLLNIKATQQATIKAIEETCVTCCGPHPYYECLSADGNTFVACAAVGPYNQGANLRGDVKAITNLSSVAYEGTLILPTFSSLPKKVEREPKVTKDKSLLSNKENLFELVNTTLTENCLMVLLKKLPEKLRDLGKFLIPCDFQGLESCMALDDLGASINLMPFSVWKKLSLLDLTPTRMTLKLATRTAHALIDVHGEELILRDDDENLIFHPDSTPKYPHNHGNESINMINLIDITCEDRFPKILKFKKSNHPSSGSTTPLSDFSPSLTPFETSDSLLEVLVDELALLDLFPSRNEDDYFNFEADLRKIEYLLNQDPLTESDIKIINPILEKFTGKPAIDYSPPPGDDDDDDDDLFDLKSDNDEWKKLLYGDSYNDIDFEKDKNKDSKMKSLVVEAHIVESNDLLPWLLDNDLTLPEKPSESSEIATLSSSSFRNKDNVVNPGIHILGRTQILKDESKDKDLKDKDLSLDDRDFLSISSDQELLFFLELIVIDTLLSFSSENEDRVFNSEILVSKGIHSFTLILSHQTYETFMIINIHPNIFNEGPMKIFPFFCFYPMDKGI
uniref:Reverse transcriptase domain-containing protein n=1 Tax=Tanacetum cinerariifolium TaxID=118510 RepID=A0A699HG14_TANCI|nr:reverse transcriptase domain-containing protein [Tanacetum cinerariifolium]